MGDENLEGCLFNSGLYLHIRKVAIETGTLNEFVWALKIAESCEIIATRLSSETTPAESAFLMANQDSLRIAYTVLGLALVNIDEIAHASEAEDFSI